MGHYEELHGKIKFDTKEDFDKYEQFCLSGGWAVKIDLFNTTWSEQAGYDNCFFPEDLIVLFPPIDGINRFDNCIRVLNDHENWSFYSLGKINYNIENTHIRTYTEDGGLSVSKIENGETEAFDNFADFVAILGQETMEKIFVNGETEFDRLIEDFMFGGTPLELLREELYDWCTDPFWDIYDEKFGSGND